ncbi:cytochrome c-type biogenesis protein CcmH [Pseudooceanicola antarcticus]|uniref:Cytochrome c-type biogenesis protein n=2 Tax=Pseudooceanicola antarcticus TaxID=1247613 RepID=A0A285J997_9RHOB|nr:cytochrome c-type biogenesis protein [Pseudooceanicola antarcticus]SNY55681.1 cytochrome c-type biogenesis protein CcmH [Pseudooceanicola antarcticus]
MTWLRRMVDSIHPTLLVLAVLVLASPALAVQPDEMLDDPVLEERAREISKELRCLVCRNENIDDSNAELARDLRLLVRERLLEGDTDEEVLDHIVGRYTEYVLLKPTTGGLNIVLWAAGPLMLLFGLGLGLGFVRARGRAQAGADVLSDEEEARLQEILKK